MSSTPGLGISPKKEMETHSSILAWEITWTGEPVGLQSSGLKRVGHDSPHVALEETSYEMGSPSCVYLRSPVLGEILVSQW